MSDADVRHGGVIDWTRLGCGVLFVVGVPGWAGLTALNVHSWVFQYRLANGMDAEPEPAVLAVAWIQAGLLTGVFLAGLGVVTVLALVALGALGRAVGRLSERRMIHRYEGAVGELDTVATDAWAGAAAKMSPDDPPEPDEELPPPEPAPGEDPDPDAPTDPGGGA